MRFLNVGGGSKKHALPGIFKGWDHVLLDIDPESDADLVCDARSLIATVRENSFDAVLCSHNLEHYAAHDVPVVLENFVGVLKDTGFVYIQVPNLTKVFERMVDGGDLDTVMYNSPAGPITALDMLFGHAGIIADSGTDFMMHKTGFTAKTLGNALYHSGFPHIFVGTQNLELFAFAFKNKPSEEQMTTLHLKARHE